VAPDFSLAFARVDVSVRRTARQVGRWNGVDDSGHRVDAGSRVYVHHGTPVNSRILADCAWNALEGVAVGKFNVTRQLLGRILLALGVLMWLPYFALQASEVDVPVTPFLILHLCGVIPGAILAPSNTLWSKIMRRLRLDE
jgi:hypothetical protein